MKRSGMGPVSRGLEVCVKPRSHPYPVNRFENGGVFMPLDTCQKAFHKDGLCSVIMVAIADGRRLSEVREWIARLQASASICCCIAEFCAWQDA